MGIKEMHNVTLTVASILKDNHEARDNDKLLLLEVWERCGLKLTAEQRQMFVEECPQSESVRRVRQKFQEQKMYLGTKRSIRAAEERNVRDGIKSVASNR